MEILQSAITNLFFLVSVFRPRKLCVVPTKSLILPSRQITVTNLGWQFKWSEKDVGYQAVVRTDWAPHCEDQAGPANGFHHFVFSIRICFVPWKSKISHLPYKERSHKTRFTPTAITRWWLNLICSMKYSSATGHACFIYILHINGLLWKVKV